MQLLASVAFTLSTLVLAHALPENGGLEIRYAYLRPHHVPRENSLSGLLRRQTCAQLGLSACIDPIGFCCPVTSVCCTGVGAGGCCDISEYCDSVDGIPGCCPNGQICTLPPTDTGANPLPSITFSSSDGGATGLPTISKNTLTGTVTPTVAGGGGGINTSPTLGSISLLPPSINPSLLPSSVGGGGQVTNAASTSPSSQTTGGSSGNPFASSGASPSTMTNLVFATLCGSVVVSLLAAVVI